MHLATHAMSSICGAAIAISEAGNAGNAGSPSMEMLQRQRDCACKISEAGNVGAPSMEMLS